METLNGGQFLSKYDPAAEAKIFDTDELLLKLAQWFEILRNGTI